MSYCIISYYATTQFLIVFIHNPNFLVLWIRKFIMFSILYIIQFFLNSFLFVMFSIMICILSIEMQWLQFQIKLTSWFSDHKFLNLMLFKIFRYLNAEIILLKRRHRIQIDRRLVRQHQRKMLNDVTYVVMRQSK